MKDATFQYNGWTIENRVYGLGSYTKTQRETSLTVHGFFNGLELLPCQTFVQHQISTVKGYMIAGIVPIAIQKTVLITDVFKTHQNWLNKHFKHTHS